MLENPPDTYIYNQLVRERDSRENEMKTALIKQAQAVATVEVLEERYSDDIGPSFNLESRRREVAHADARVKRAEKSLATHNRAMDWFVLNYMEKNSAALPECMESR